MHDTQVCLFAGRDLVVRHLPGGATRLPLRDELPPRCLASHEAGRFDNGNTQYIILSTDAIAPPTTRRHRHIAPAPALRDHEHHRLHGCVQGLADSLLGQPQPVLSGMRRADTAFRRHRQTLHDMQLRDIPVDTSGRHSAHRAQRRDTAREGAQLPRQSLRPRGGLRGAGRDIRGVCKARGHGRDRIEHQRFTVLWQPVVAVPLGHHGRLHGAICRRRHTIADRGVGRCRLLPPRQPPHPARPHEHRPTAHRRLDSTAQIDRRSLHDTQCYLLNACAS